MQEKYASVTNKKQEFSKQIKLQNSKWKLLQCK